MHLNILHTEGECITVSPQDIEPKDAISLSSLLQLDIKFL